MTSLMLAFLVCKSRPRLRVEQCCDRADCARPAHLGGLCPMHFMGGDAVERAIALYIDALTKEFP